MPALNSDKKTIRQYSLSEDFDDALSKFLLIQSLGQAFLVIFCVWNVIRALFVV